MFVPATVLVPSVNAAFIDVRARVPLTTSVTSVVDPACTVAGAVIASVGCGFDAAWQLVVQVADMPLYGLPE